MATKFYDFVPYGSDEEPMIREFTATRVTNHFFWYISEEKWDKGRERKARKKFYFPSRQACLAESIQGLESDLKEFRERIARKEYELKVLRQMAETK